MRLIDADALLERLDIPNEGCDTCPHREGHHCDYVNFSEVCIAIEDAPTVEPIKVGDVCKECWREGGNVVEVVRCKDCRHRDPEDHKCDSGEDERQGCPFKVADDYFCAYGER